MSVVIPSLRAAVAVPGWAKNELWRKARAVPSLDLRFADNKSLTDAVTGASLVTFTRASSGTFVDSAGVIQTAATDVPRFDHNPTTLESLGLLVEEARTNSLTNNTMVGAVAGTPGTNPTGWFLTASANGISPEIVGTGVEDGVTYVDIRYSGTSTGAGSFLILASTVTAITAATGQSWTGSAYVKLQAGSVSGLTSTAHSVNGRTAVGGGLESTNVTYTPTSDRLGVQRRTVSITLANALSARISHTIFNGSYASGVAINITLRIGLPQLEQGAFATSPILTSTAAVTRSADVASITNANLLPWFTSSLTDHTFYVEARGGGTTTSVTLEGYEGANLKGLSITVLSRPRMIQRHGASRFDTAAQAADIGLGNRARIAVVTSSNSSSALNGSAVSVGSTPGQADWTVGSSLSIGSRVASQLFFTGTIQRLTYWPLPLASSTLQQITQ